MVKGNFGKSFLGILPFFLLTLFYSGCKKETAEYYHRFPDKIWRRFDKLTFKIPVEKSGQPHNILFFADHTNEYEFDDLKFNMILNTPAGEERIREFTLQVKKNGTFSGKCKGDSCEVEIPLVTEMNFQKNGNLEIEIEALVPRLEIKGLLGVGIRIVPD